MNDIHFSLISFKKLSWKLFKKIYLSSIRVNSDVAKITPVKLEVILADDKMKLFGVWYSKGSWRDGKQKKLKIGSKNILVRLPAFRIKGSDNILVVDGMHRVADLKPKMIVLDLVTIRKSDAIFINDMIRWLIK